MASAASSTAVSAPEVEAQHSHEIKRCFKLLHRWSDKSWGPGFDVLVFPECVMQLQPTPADPTSSKIVVFPTSKAVKFRVIYTANTDTGQTLQSTPSSAAPPQSQECVSELRICLRDCSQSDGIDTGQTDHDIVLRWKDGTK